MKITTGLKKYGLLIGLYFLIVCPIFGQADAEYEEKLTEMFELSGTNESYQAAMKQMFTLFKQQFNNVDPALWEELEADFSTASITDLKKKLTPVYFKYLTKSDLEELIKFYKSDVGKKFAKNTPFIMQKSMQIGQEWGMEIGKKFKKRMDERGY